MELACANTHGIDIVDVVEPSLQNVETARTNFPALNIRHGYIGTELAKDGAHADVCYVNIAKRSYSAKESSIPIVDKNMAGSCGNGVLVMKNAFRLISLQEPEMFVIESGLHIHTAASEAFAAIPGYYIRQIVIRNASACGYPMRKQKSFIVGTKRDFNIRWNRKPVQKLTSFLEKDVDYKELPAYAVNRMNGLTRGWPSVIIDPLYLSLLWLLCHLQSIWQFSFSVFPPRDHGTNSSAAVGYVWPSFRASQYGHRCFCFSYTCLLILSSKFLRERWRSSPSMIFLRFFVAVT